MSSKSCELVLTRQTRDLTVMVLQVAATTVVVTAMRGRQETREILVTMEETRETREIREMQEMPATQGILVMQETGASEIHEIAVRPQ